MSETVRLRQKKLNLDPESYIYKPRYGLTTPNASPIETHV